MSVVNMAHNPKLNEQTHEQIKQNDMKYRFKTLEEFEKEFEKNGDGSFEVGKEEFFEAMFHLCGVELPDWASKKILKSDTGICLDLGKLVPGKENCWMFTKEMITPVEEPGKFYPFAEEVEMLVWDIDESKALKRTVFGRKNGRFLAWYIHSPCSSTQWKNAKPLPQPVTVTMQEIAEWKGVDVEQIKVEG